MTPQQVAAWVDASAAAVGLALDPAHRPGVLRYAALAAEFAAVLASAPSTVTDEPAETFVPIGPDDLQAGA